MNATHGLRASTIAVLLAMLPAGALAADLPMRNGGAVRGPGAPPPIPIYNWSGFYIGGNVGGGFESSTVTDDHLLTSVDNNPSGFIGGGQIGYNWQVAPTWVLGVEWMFDGASIDSTDTDPTRTLVSHSNVDWLTTVTGRVGYAANNWLFYAKGGGGWIHDSHTLTDLVDDTSFGISDTQGGWVVGAGIEYGITRNWTIRVDYTHIGLDDETVPGFVDVAPGDFATISRHFDLVTGGLNYKFSW